MSSLEEPIIIFDTIDKELFCNLTGLNSNLVTVTLLDDLTTGTITCKAKNS